MADTSVTPQVTWSEWLSPITDGVTNVTSHIATLVKEFIKGVIEISGTFLKSMGGSALVMLLLAMVVGYYAYNYGNEHGTYATAYREYVAEVEQKRAEEAKLAKDDEQIAIREAALNQAVSSEFAKDTAKLKPLPVNKVQAEAFNKLVRSINTQIED